MNSGPRIIFKKGKKNSVTKAIMRVYCVLLQHSE